MQKIKGGARDVRSAIDWNGETYAFGLHIPKKGDPPLAEVRAATGPGRMARESDAPGATLDMPPIVAVPTHPVAADLAPAKVDPVVAGPKMLEPARGRAERLGGRKHVAITVGDVR